MLTEQRRKGAAIYFATLDGRSVFKEQLARKSVLVLGNESHGLSPTVLAVGGSEIAIPGKGGAESLNVAMAAAAFCTEFARQRGTA
jgi:TrmH family RNA methyltransferase